MNLGKTTHLTMKNRTTEALAINCKLTYLTSIVVCTDRPLSINTDDANSVFQFRRDERVDGQTHQSLEGNSGREEGGRS